MRMEENKTNHIEETLAHQEQQIQDLGEMVNRQWQEIDLLKKQLEKTNAKLGVLEETAGSSESDGLSVTERAARDKPPHY